MWTTYDRKSSMALLCLTKSFEMISSYTGLGPGGLTIEGKEFLVNQRCIVGSSHGGYAGADAELESGQPYDTENLTSLLGGSGGEFKFFSSYELLACEH